MSQERENASAIFAALDRGESLPAAWYTDARITEREVQEIFRKSWNYIGPAKELANVGDYITGYAGMTQPWGGFKQSGTGRDKCLETLLTVSQTKSVWVNLT